MITDGFENVAPGALVELADCQCLTPATLTSSTLVLDRPKKHLLSAPTAAPLCSWAERDGN